MNSIVFENDQFLIANKMHNIPTVPLKDQNPDGTLLGFVQSLRPEVLQIFGKNRWEGGALHRLDTATSGLVLFAKTQEFYDYIITIQNEDKFEKTYIAKCDEGSLITEKYISSYFRAFGPGSKMVKAEQDVRKADSDKLYTTYVTRLTKGLYSCKLTRGFRHQIRVHLATKGCPIVGDVLYNPNKTNGDMMLTCTGLSFPMPDGSIFNYSLQ